MFQNKLVAIVNKQISTGVVLNALAHMCVGFGAHMGATELHLMDYFDEEGQVYPNISKMPFIILQEKNSNKLKALFQKGKESGLKYSAFTQTMTEGSWQDQEERTKKTKGEELIFYGLVLFGPKEIVTELTKKLSLWRDS